MPKKRLLWQLYPSYFLITLFALISLSVLLIHSFKQRYLEQISTDLEARARLVESAVLENGLLMGLQQLSILVPEMGKKNSMRITIVGADGDVLADSDDDPARMDNHLHRPEIEKALATGRGESTRYSQTVKANMMYLALPLSQGGEKAGAVRVAVSMSSVESALASIQSKVLWIVGLIALLAGLASFWVSKWMSSPLVEMTKGAQRFAEGDFGTKLSISDVHELGGLAEAMNQMAAQLDERIRTVIRQQKEQEAVLSSMVEGVLAVDIDEKVLSLNQAAAKLFRIAPSKVQGKGLRELVRNTDLHRFVQRTLSGESPIEDEIVLFEEEERFLQLNGNILRDAQHEKIGALVVLNDVTRLRKLENLRRDFVANVSHELKTPITSIKGFVETLLDGAIVNPQDAKRFLEIIANQADRLNAIIEDLLSLSRIEQGSERGQVQLERHSLAKIVRAAAQNCEIKAKEKQIQIELDCEESIEAKVNAQLLEQAMVNLIDNAIKYSDPQNTVQVSCSLRNGAALLSVKDHGYGIESEHLDRIFERFYRVDKSRSRKMGGTGLGLAIVKHIVQAHQGTIHVESAPGKGSHFFISIPLTLSQKTL